MIFTIMNKYLPLILKALLAGLLIGLAGLVYISIENKILGSFLFSFGLVGVLLLEANLFTGKVGYINSKDTLIDGLIILVFNLVAAFIVGLVYRLCNGAPATAMDSRLAKTWYRLFFDGVGCGALIYLATECFKRTKNIIPAIICVMAFILGGFEHCIADMFYYGASELTWIGLLDILLVILGNSAGSLLVRFLQVGIENKKTPTSLN